MLLRSISKHVKDQNWFAVVLDFFIVVAGILIAIQISNWNETRADRALAKDYIYRLHSDMNRSIEATQSTRDFISDNAERLKRARAWLKSCDLPEESRDDFANTLYHFGKVIPAQFISGTYDEMKASGRVGLLRNVQLRDRLNEAARQIEYQQSIWNAYQGRAKIPQGYVDQKTIFSFDVHPGGLGAASWESLETEFSDLCDDPQLLASFSTIDQLGFHNIDFLDRNLENFKDAKRALEEEIGAISGKEGVK